MAIYALLAAAGEALARAWHWLTTSRYTRLLEHRVAELETENRLLRNRVFDERVDPATGHAMPRVQHKPVRRLNWQQFRQKLEAEGFRKAEERRREAAQAAQSN